MKRAILILMVFVIQFSVIGCSDNSNESTSSNQNKFNFDTRLSIKEKGDWIYFFEVDYLKKSTKPKNYNFNAYNLKHKTLKDYKIPIKDENGKIVSYDTPSLPYLSLNKKFENDFFVLQEYFDKNKPTSSINEKNLGNLKIENLDKSMVISLYNKSISSSMLKQGKYCDLPEADIIQENTEIDGYKWQLGYLIMHGNIVAVKIDVVFSDGTYLSDKTTRNEMAAYTIIKKVEENIIDSQSFTIKSENFNSNLVDYNRLATLASPIENGSSEND